MLGQLRAVEAVPTLIKILGLWDTRGLGKRHWGPEKVALIEIGAPAVPELLNTLRQAEEKRQTFRLDDGSVASYLEIQLRIVDILGRIGDERVLDLIEELKKSNDAPRFQSYLKEAEEMIKEKALQK